MSRFHKEWAKDPRGDNFVVRGRHYQYRFRVFTGGNHEEGYVVSRERKNAGSRESNSVATCLGVIIMTVIVLAIVWFVAKEASS